MKVILFSLMLMVLTCVDCGSARNVGEIQRATKIVVRDRQNATIREITDQSRIAKILVFINNQRNGWEAPLFDTPVPRLIVDIYDDEHFVGHFGIARTFFETHRNGEFFSKKASQPDVEDFLRLIDVDRMLVFGKQG